MIFCNIVSCFLESDLYDFNLKVIRLFVSAEGFANNKTNTPAEIIVNKKAFLKL